MSGLGVQRVIQLTHLALGHQRSTEVALPFQHVALCQQLVVAQRGVTLLRHHAHHLCVMVASLFDIDLAEQRQCVALSRRVFGQHGGFVGVAFCFLQVALQHFVVGTVTFDDRLLAAVGLLIEACSLQRDAPRRVVQSHVVERVGLVDEHIDHQFRFSVFSGIVKGEPLVVQGQFVGAAGLVNPSDVLADLVFRLRVFQCRQQLFSLFQLQHG